MESCSFFYRIKINNNICWFYQFFFLHFIMVFAFSFVSLKKKIISDRHEIYSIIPYFSSSARADETLNIEFLFVLLKIIWHIICIIRRALLRIDREHEDNDKMCDHCFVCSWRSFILRHILSIVSVWPNPSLWTSW